MSAEWSLYTAWLQRNGLRQKTASNHATIFIEKISQALGMHIE